MFQFVNNLICSLITTVFSLIFVRLILKKESKTKLIYIFIFLVMVATIISIPYVYDSQYLKTFLSCYLCMIMFRLIFNVNIYEALLYSIIFMMMLTISEAVVFVFVTKVILMDGNYLYNVFAGSIIGNFTVAGSCMIISFILQKLLIKITNIKIKIYLIIYAILLFLCLIFLFYVIFSSIETGADFIFGGCALIVMLVVFINLLLQSYKNNELIIKYDKLLDFIKKYEIEIDKQRTLRHETRNQLLTIKSKLIDSSQSTDIIEYINQVLDDNNNEIKYTLYAKFNNLPSNGIKGLFYFKVNEAQEKGINVSVNISNSIKDSLIKDLSPIMFNQLGKLIGIILDNAIEEAEMTKDSAIGIEIYCLRGYVEIIISNTYLNKSNGVVFSHSSKGYNRGYGLSLARNIINNYKLFSLETTITDDLYIQKIKVNSLI